MSRRPRPAVVLAACAVLGIALVVVTAGGARARLVSRGSTSFHLVNVGADPAAVALNLRPQGGGEAARIEGLNIPARGTFYTLMARHDIPSGVRYAASFDGASDVAVVAQSNWASGAEVAIEGAAAAHELVVPYASRARHRRRTLVTVQNTDQNAPASVEVTLLGTEGGSIRSFDLDVAAGSSTTFEVGRTPEPVLDGFEGALRLVGDRPIAATVFVDGLDNTLGGSGFAAAPPEDVGPRLVAPFLPIGANGVAGRRLDTLVAIQNVAAADAAVAVSLVGVTGACVGQEAEVLLDVPADGVAHLVLTPAATGLPEGCVAAGTVASGEEALLAAVVVLAGNTTGLSAMAAYTARPDDAARPALWVPVLRRAHGQARLESAVWLFNPGADDATVDIEMRDEAGGLLGCDGCQLEVPAGGGARFTGAVGGALAAGTFGYAIVGSDLPLLGVVEEAGPLDAPGLAVRDTVVSGLAGGADAGRRWVPIALYTAAEAPADSTAPPPTRIPTPGPSAWSTPVAGKLEEELHTSFIRVFNRGASPREPMLRLLPRVPGAPKEVVIPNVGPGRSGGAYVHSMVQGRGAYAAVRSDADVVDGQGAMGWFGGGSVAYASTRADTMILLPLALEAVERARIRLVNASSGVAEADVRIDDQVETRLIPALGFITIGVPAGTTAVAIASDVPIVASALVFNDTELRAAYDVEGHGSGAASAERWVPRAYRNAAFPGGIGIARSTRLAIANPGDVTVEATLHLAGDAASCAGQPIDLGPWEVPAGDVTAIDLAEEGAVPDGCEGPLRIAADGPVVANAVAFVRSAGAVVAASSAPAVPATAGHTAAWIPTLAYEWPSIGPSRTDVVVVNPGAVASHVQLLARDSNDQEVAVAGGDVVIPPGGGHVFQAHSALAALHGRFGTGTLLADAPVIARLDLWGATGLNDTWSVLAGNAGLATPAPGEDVLAWANTNEAIVTPMPPSMPPPTPEPPLALVAAAFVDVAGGASSACPSCDGVYDEDDRNAAATAPLPTLRFVVRDAEGRLLTAGRSRAVSGIQVARLTFAASELARRPVLSVEDVAEGWSLCPNAPLSRPLALQDFPLGTARFDFHLTNACVPDGSLPPITSPELPELPADLGRSTVFVPWAGARP